MKVLFILYLRPNLRSAEMGLRHCGGGGEAKVPGMKQSS